MPDPSNWEIEPPASLSAEVMGIRHAIRFLLRNSPLILLGLAAGIALGLVLQKITPTAFESKGKFVVDELPFSKQADGSMDAETERQLVQTLILSIGSRDMAAVAAERLRIPKERLSFAGIDLPLKLTSASPQANIEVSATKESRIGVVMATSQSAEFAADVVNAILEQLKLYNQIGGRLKQLRFDLGLATNKAASILSQIVEVSEKRITLEQQNAELAVYISRRLPLETFTAFSSDATLNNLKTQLVLVQSDYDSIAATTTMGARLTGKKSELAGLRSQITRHAESLAGAMKSELEILSTRERDLKAELAKVQKQIQESNDSSARLIQSFGDPVAMRTLIKDYPALSGSGGNVVVVIDRGSPSKKPSRPKLSMNLAIGAILGLTLGFAAAMLRALLDNRLHSMEMVEQKTGAPCLAMLPKLDRIEKRKSIFDRGRTPLGLGYLRTHFLRTVNDSPGRDIIAFSPARRASDASRIVAGLGVLLAQSNRRTLIIDLQRQSPIIASILGVQKADGLSEWLNSDVPLADCVGLTSSKDLGVLGFGKVGRDLDDQLGSRPLALEMPSLNEEWDFILVNAPAIRFDWTTMLTLPTQSLIIITADYHSSRAADVVSTAQRARNSRWKVEGVVLQNCPQRLTGVRAL